MLELMISRGQEQILYARVQTLIWAYRLIKGFGAIYDNKGPIDNYDKFRGKLRRNSCLTITAGTFDVTVLKALA